MKSSIRELLARVIILMIGLTIAHLGVTLFVLADLGTDPFNVLVQGVFRTLSGWLQWPFLTHGRVHVAMCLLIVLVLLAVDRSYIRIGTLLCMLFGGPIIDVFTVVLAPLFTPERTLVFKLIMLVLGCVILAYGMTAVIRSQAGTGPNDLVAVVISDKSKKKFSVVRIVTDVAFVAIGFALGGSFGVGTLICAACVGPVAGIFLPINGRLIDRILKKVNA
jgi:uncharacterized membrane protein YczE